jgi:hypothetical protein
MSGTGIRRLASEDAEQECGKQAADGHDTSGQTTLLRGLLEISAHPASPPAGSETFGTEFTVSRYDVLTSSKRLMHSGSNMANPNAKILERERKISGALHQPHRSQACAILLGS